MSERCTDGAIKEIKRMNKNNKMEQIICKNN